MHVFKTICAILTLIYVCVVVSFSLNYTEFYLIFLPYLYSQHEFSGFRDYIKIYHLDSYFGVLTTVLLRYLLLMISILMNNSK